MKFKNIRIVNFKSITDLTIPFNSYGKNTGKSNTTILVGLNESGKSAILEAMSLANTGLNNIDYANYCYNDAQENDSYIDIFYNFEIVNQNEWRKLIPDNIVYDKKFLDDIEILTFTKNIYMSLEEGALEVFSIKVNENFPFYKYTVFKDTNGIEKIQLLKKKPNIKESITAETAKSHLLIGEKLLDVNSLQRIILNHTTDYLNNLIPSVQTWKPDPAHLINEEIELEDFIDGTSPSIPLKNIFSIYGKKTDNEIKTTIEQALKNFPRKAELQEKLSDSVTKYINKIWKEHKIKINVQINGTKCYVLVEDKDKKFAFYKMNQRSDGFKQFISLILSISAKNDSQKLSGNLILIDEPEVHLHPSGIKYMRDEILKIGKSNFVFVSTHSQYMIDTDCPERHFIVSKEKSETSITQLSDTTNIIDDSVLASAFGLELFKELLPKNILVVEGNDDKIILSHSLKLISSKSNYTMKSAGGASKMPGFARLLSNENICPCLYSMTTKKEMTIKKKLLQSSLKIILTKMSLR